MSRNLDEYDFTVQRTTNGWRATARVHNSLESESGNGDYASPTAALAALCGELTSTATPSISAVSGFGIGWRSTLTGVAGHAEKPFTADIEVARAECARLDGKFVGMKHMPRWYGPVVARCNS